MSMTSRSVGTFFATDKVAAEVRQILAITSCVIEGHFVLKNADANVKADRPTVPGEGDHSPTYVAKDIIGTHPQHIWTLGEILSGMFESHLSADLMKLVIASPAIGAIRLQDAVARILTLTGRDIRTVFSEKTPEGKQKLDRGFASVVEDQRVIVIDDIGTTGGSVKDLIAAIRAAGGDPIAAAFLTIRGNITAERLDVPLMLALSKVDAPKYPASSCPFCRSGSKITTTPGHGADFLRLLAKNDSALFTRLAPEGFVV